jgi:hypothetical protein
MVPAVGKHDSRNSMKMKRRKAQVKKKARLKRHTRDRKVAAQGSKKAVGLKKSAKATAQTPPTSAPISAPAATTPTGSAPIG